MAQASKEATSNATNNSSSPDDEEEEEEAAVSSEEISHGNDDDLCIQSKLPTRAGWSEPLVLYQNYWFRPLHVPNIMHAQHNFKPRRDAQHNFKSVKHVIRLAAFLGVPFTAKEEEDGVPEEVVRLCSFDKLSSLHTNQTGEFARRGSIVLEKSAFFRKGIVGGWVNHMSQEMGRKIDRVMEENFKGSGLVL